MNRLPKKTNKETNPDSEGTKLPDTQIHASTLQQVSSGSPDVKSQRAALAQAWISVAVWMTFGLLLEGLLGYKTPAYLLDDDRRELFRLAHAHGTILGLLLIAAAITAERVYGRQMRAALVAIRVGSIMMPFGFLLAGIWHYESDPGYGIWLVPPGALLLIFGIVAFAVTGLEQLRTK